MFLFSMLLLPQTPLLGLHSNLSRKCYTIHWLRLNNCDPKVLTGSAVHCTNKLRPSPVSHHLKPSPLTAHWSAIQGGLAAAINSRFSLSFSNSRAGRIRRSFRRHGQSGRYRFVILPRRATTQSHRIRSRNIWP